MNYLNYVKYIALIIVTCTIVYFVKDYLDKKQFEKDTKANELYQQRFDSLRISYIKLTDEQMMNVLKSNSEYKALLKENNIKFKRVESLLKYKLEYRDTTIVNTDLSAILNAVNKKENYVKPFKDSTLCLLIKGTVEYTDGNLSLNISDRIFNDETTAIGYLERREWSFLGFKTRFLGKLQGTAKVTDKCGKSQIINLIKK